MEEIECPTDFSYTYTLANKPYIVFHTAQKVTVYTVISMNDKTGLKLSPMFHSDTGDLAINDLFGHFLITENSTKALLATLLDAQNPETS
jgi:hypothetical protein